MTMKVTKYYLYILINLFVLILSGNVMAYNIETIKFSHISINEGLSQSTVFSITQDNSDNMWFATYDGVNRYDGYEFTIYRNNDKDSTSIAGDIARCVMTDSHGRVFVGTDKGVSYYKREDDSFVNFVINGRKNVLVTDIIELSDGLYLINSGSRLCVLDVKTSSYIDGFLPAGLSDKHVSCLYKVNNTIYVGCMNGSLLAYSDNGDRLTLVSTYEIGARIQSILLMNVNELWVGTEGNGLMVIDVQSGDTIHYRHDGKEGSISSNYIRSLAKDSNGRLWVGTFNDLNIYVKSSDSFIRYTNDQTDPESLSQRSVRCIFKDNQGGMWLGTFFGGLNYYHPLKNRFRNIRHEPYKNSLSDNVVSCIVEDELSNLWIGTNDGGLNRYNPKDGSFRFYHFDHGDDGISRESNNVKAVYIDEASNKVYVGTHAGGMKEINRSTGSIRHRYIGNLGSSSNSIYVILPRDKKSLWLGTLEGLYVYDIVDGSFTPEMDTSVFGKAIYAMYKDTAGSLWVALEDEMLRFSVSEGKLRKLSFDIPSVSNIKTAQCIYQGFDGKIWFGTRSGLYSFDEKNGELIHLTNTDGLPNNVIYGIEEDSFNNIWVSTNMGLSCYNPLSGKFRNFTIADGIQSNQFNSYSHCRTSDGQLYFGGINGITTFRPELLIDNPYSPRPVITKLMIYDKEVRPGDDTGILKKHISDTDSITLDNSHRSFTLKFVVSNYLAGKHNTFSYMLEGYDENWIQAHSERSVSYINLPHGEYRFKVRSANNDGKWNNNPKILYIKILPVWYETWWAATIMFICVVLTVYLVLRHFWVKKEMQARLEMEHKEKIHQEEINQMKMRFFINISHELRTPLTLIMAPIQEMKIRATDKWMKEQLGFVERNTVRLLHMVNQLMDYRRAELGVFKLRVTKNNIYSTVKECFSFYEKLARHKSLSYNLVSDLDGIDVLADAKYVEIILNNLLSNSFKYTKEGSITVSLSLKGSFLVLSVADTGVGISANNHKKIFERFFQLDSEHVGSGIGLSLVQRLVELHHGRIELESEPGKGSTFYVYLPQNISAYKEDEIADSQTDIEAPAHFTNTKELFFIDSDEETDSTVDSDDCSARGTILVVEDNDEVRHYLKSGLSKVFSVLQAENGEIALDILKNNSVDIVITDVMMPVMDGVKLCKNIKQNVSTCHIPVIMLSAKTDMAAQKEALDMGADDYIPKPFSLSVVITKIQNMMRTRHRMIEHYSKELSVEPEKITFNPVDEELLKRAVDIVKENLDNTDFSTEDFASRMNMSRSNLHLKLKALTGESAIEFIKKIRFSEACRLLKEGRYNVAEISVMVGFSTPSYFATSFKKYIGCLPTEYIKQQK